MDSSKEYRNETPDYYHRLTSKQQRNWRRNAKKTERNDELRERYPPFQTTSSIDIIHIHHRSTITTIESLISKAKTTKRYVVDTECEKGKREKHGALIQIQFVHSTTESTTILIETNYLPDSQSMLYMRIKELCSIIFGTNNEILSWGELQNEFEHFEHLGLIEISKNTIEIDLQFRFGEIYGNRRTHPERESRGDVGMDDSDIVYPNQGNFRWSLQNAVAVQLKEFLDKTETVNFWNCGLDCLLGTWQQKWFNKYRFDAKFEQEKRKRMIKYAVNDCAAVAELFFVLFPPQQDPSFTTNPIRTTIIESNENQRLRWTPDEEIIEHGRAKFEQNPIQHDLIELELQPEIEEIEEFVESNRQIQEIEEFAESNRQRKTKSERQRLKNEKLKWKRRNRPDFQNKLKRPIYYRYNYQKIRAQLKQDRIQTTHQITIDTKKLEVMIGFKSNEELRRAMITVPIEYFSRENFRERWG